MSYGEIETFFAQRNSKAHLCLWWLVSSPTDRRSGVWDEQGPAYPRRMLHGEDSLRGHMKIKASDE